MKRYILILFSMISMAAGAQVPEDAIRYSWLPHNGTARYMAIGGVMGSLGGDLTAAHINPAGIAFYNTGEVVLTPSILLNKNKSTFRDGNTFIDKNNVFNLGTIGLVNGFSEKIDFLKNTSFAIAFTQTANFNNIIRYSALNNHSSFTEQFAEEFAASGQSIDNILNTGSTLPYTSAPALYTYLIDTLWDGSKYIIKGAPESILDAGQALRQEMFRSTKGGAYELAFNIAGHNKGKLFTGLTLGIPIIGYKSYSTFTETDTSSNTANLFKKAVFTDNFKTNGAGGNLKFGMIYRPQEYIRLGFAIHSPSFIYQTDERTTSIYHQKEGTDSLREEFASSDLFTADSKMKNSYIQQTPWKAMISASYVFREVENVRRQKGFISVDIEYVNHRSSRFRVEEESEESAPKQRYYKALNNTLKNQYKGAFNFRLGGELKFNVIMVRLGLAHYTNPYKDKGLKAARTLLSGGLGYRHKGMFIDVTYVHHMNKDVHFPYRLADRQNTYAMLKQTTGQVSATIGVKL